MYQNKVKHFTSKVKDLRTVGQKYCKNTQIYHCQPLILKYLSSAAVVIGTITTAAADKSFSIFLDLDKNKVCYFI